MPQPSQLIWANVEQVRTQAPLVHNITNFVVMNNTANALLAFGASPAMVHAPEEVEDFISIASALVINIGTLDATFVAGMKRAMSRAKELGKPIVFDPVGVGQQRTETALARSYWNWQPPPLFGVMPLKLWHWQG